MNIVVHSNASQFTYEGHVDIKAKLSLCTQPSHTGGILPVILNLGTRWRWVVSFTPWTLYARWKRQRYPRMGCWVGLKASESLERKSVAPAEHLTAIPCLSIVLPSHYTDSQARNQMYQWAIWSVRICASSDHQPSQTKCPSNYSPLRQRPPATLTFWTTKYNWERHPRITATANKQKTIRFLRFGKRDTQNNIFSPFSLVKLHDRGS